jgi:hypothetical protein
VRWNTPQQVEDSVVRWNKPQQVEDSAVPWNAPQQVEDSVVRWNTPQRVEDSGVLWNAPQQVEDSAVLWNAPQRVEDSGVRWVYPRRSCFVGLQREWEWTRGFSFAVLQPERCSCPWLSSEPGLCHMRRVGGGSGANPGLGHAPATPFRVWGLMSNTSCFCSATAGTGPDKGLFFCGTTA